MSYREIPVIADDGVLHVGASLFHVARPNLAVKLQSEYSHPVVLLTARNQFVTPDELRRLADELEARYGRREQAYVPTPDEVQNYGGTD